MTHVAMARDANHRSMAYQDENGNRGMAGWLDRRNKKDPPSDEEIAIREAQDAVNRRVRFFGHAVVWGMTSFFLMITAGIGSALIVAAAWGIGLAVQGYYAVIAPDLRRKWMQIEVDMRLRRTSEAERKQLVGKHARSLEELSASIAHEIRNPITAAKSLVQQMGEDPASGENVEYARIAIDELDRVERSISHLLRYAREEELRTEPTDLVDVVDSALETFRDRLGKSAVRVERDLDSGSTLQADPEKLRRVVINLVGNALDELEAAGSANPSVRISSGRNLAGTDLWVRVKDNGPGIPADRVEKIFSPFHTSKANGTGLGLAISKKLVEAHNGTIEVESVVGAGTEFILTFPLVREEAPA